MKKKKERVGRENTKIIRWFDDVRYAMLCCATYFERVVSPEMHAVDK